MMSTTQEQANEELRLIFSSKAWRYEPETMSSAGLTSRVLEILQSFPELAKERYKSGLASQITPLLCVCCARACATGVPMRVIQAVYDLYPMAAAVRQGKWMRTPLDLACRLRAPKLVIKFLVDRFRPAIYMTNQEGKYPLELLVDHYVWRSHVGMELTLELCPGVITRDLRFGDFSTRTLFEEALVCGFCFHDLMLLVQKFPPEELTVPSDASLEGEQSKLVLDLIPKLQSLAVHSTLWSQEAIEKVSEELCINQSIKQLGTLVLLRRMLPVWNCQLQDILARNSHIETLQLKVVRSLGDVEAPLSDAILRGLCCNETIQELELDGFDCLDPLQDDDNDCWNNSRSAVCRLVLKNCSVSFQAFLRLLRIFPHLTKLTMEYVMFEGESTSFVVHALEHCKLTSLSIQCRPTTPYDASLISHALQQNTSLKHFHVSFGFNSVSKQEELVAALEVNTTLEGIDPFCFTFFPDPERKAELKIKHLLELNKRGRGQVRSSETSLGRFVQLLAPEGNSHGVNTKLEHQIQHGLLHEGLMLWAI